MREVANGAKKLSIIVAEEVQYKGFKRVIDAIDPSLLTQTVENVVNAFNGSKMMTAGQKAKADKLIITCVRDQVKHLNGSADGK